jgi:MFS family permease
MLWLGGVTMQVGMQLRTLATAQWLFDTSGSAAQLGILGIFQLIPIPITLFGGALADSVDRKKLMVMTQGVSLAALLILTVAAATGTLASWQIFAVTAVTGIVGALGNAARPAMVARVVPRSKIPHAITMNTSSMQVGGILAPIIFGVIYSLFGVAVTLAVASGLTALSVVTPMLIRASGAPEGGSRRVTMPVLVQGWGFVLRHPILPGLYLLDIGVTVVSFYRELFPIFASKLYGCDSGAEVNECARQVGWLSSTNAIGMLAGSLLVFFTARVQRKGLLVLWATLAYALLLFAFGLNKNLYLGLVIVVGLGLSDAVTMTMRQAIVQLTTPDAMLGRASSAHSFAAMGANQVGKIEVAFMSAAVGAGPTLVIGGFVATGVTALIWWRVKGVRRYRYVEGAGMPGGARPTLSPASAAAPATAGPPPRA